MPKAHWTARADVRDSEKYSRYAEMATEIFKLYSARVLARGGLAVHLEGRSRLRNVVIKFDDIAQAQACYESQGYQDARLHRLGASDAKIVIVKGA